MKNVELYTDVQFCQSMTGPLCEGCVCGLNVLINIFLNIFTTILTQMI